MSTAAIHPARIAVLHDAPPGEGEFVLYWMQASQRTRFNHALEFAAGRANALRKPLVVLFVLMEDYPDANLRHFAFMLEGLAEVAASLRKRGAALLLRRGRPGEIVPALARKACEVVCDRGYLRHQRRWRDEVADAVQARVTQVESDVVVPVEVASDHAEFAARTIRPRIVRVMEEFLRPLSEVRLQVRAERLTLRGDLDAEDPARAMASLHVDRAVAPSRRFAGGEREAVRRLREFLAQRLPRYTEDRSDPSLGGGSEMSPYLHFGEISPVEMALAARESGAPKRQVDAFVEELVVRRELAINHVYYTSAYDTYEAVPTWARRALAAAARDARPVSYSRAELEAGQTHDRWWNAAMLEMRQTGFMHNYMRMYWGKKVLEWKPDPREAFEDLIYMDNRYFLDGRDASGYAGVAWCFGLHDRPWTRRPIFGHIRYMSAAGLERKFEMAAYERTVRQGAGE